MAHRLLRSPPQDQWKCECQSRRHAECHGYITSPDFGAPSPFFTRKHAGWVRVRVRVDSVDSWSDGEVIVQYSPDTYVSWLTRSEWTKT